MKTKTTKTLYWIITTLFALFLLMDGIMGVTRIKEGQEIMIHLGYPVYILTILGVAKLFAAIGIVQTPYKTLKEWAYAGLTFHFLGACASRAYGGDSIALIVSPLIFLSVLLVSYFLWKKLERQGAERSLQVSLTEEVLA